MKYILLALVVLFSLNSLQAQTPALVWVKQVGSVAFDQCRSVAVDAAGNVYSAGVFGGVVASGAVDFDPGAGTFNLTTAGDYDVYIQKLDAAGNFLWAKRMGNTFADISLAIAVDAAGNVYTTSTYQGTIDLDPGAGTFNVTSTGSLEVFVNKLDASGNFVWGKSIGGTGDERSVSIATDASGNVLVTGYYNDNADFDPGAGTFNLTAVGGSADIFLLKLDGSGNFVWAKTIGNTGFDGGYSVATDASGNVYTSGTFTATVDFDPGAATSNLTSAGLADVFVLKLDVSGNYVWARNFGGSGNDLGYSIKVDASGNVYTTGIFQSTADFDPGAATFNLSSAGNNDIFISKLNSSGNFAWAKGIGSVNDDLGYSLALDAAGNAYTTGVLGGTADFDPGAGTFNLSSSGGNDIYINKLDASGNFVWARNLGGTSNDAGYSVTTDALGNVIVGGFFEGTADLDPAASTFNLTSVGLDDIFVLKLTESAITPVELVSFTAKAEVKDVVLNWRTLSENNSNHFVIEKSENSQTYNSIGKVAASGTTSAPHSYSFIDNTPASSNVVYYRLKQVDKDSSYKYSQVVSVKSGNAPLQIVNVYSSGSQTFVAELVSNKKQDISIQFINTDGKVLEQTSKSLTTGTNKLTLKPGAALKTGWIYIRFNGDELNKTVPVLNK